MFVPAAARQRHAPGGGGPGLLTGRRICLMIAPAGSGGSRVSAAGTASKVALVSQMVAAEGGTLVRAPGQGEGGGGSRGATSPSPSPEGATLLVSMAQGPMEARAAVKIAQVGRCCHWAGRAAAADAAAGSGRVAAAANTAVAGMAVLLLLLPLPCRCALMFVCIKLCLGVLHLHCPFCLTSYQLKGPTHRCQPMQKRYPGRPLHHQSWLFDSLCCGR